MCKFGGLLIAFDASTGRCLVTDADCESWKCPECEKMMRDRWVRRAQHGATEFQKRGIDVYFATITSHEKQKTFGACAAVWPDAWKKLHKLLAKTSDVGEYIMVPERHVDGRMHVHAIWTYPVKTRWLKDNCRACGLGYMALVGRRGHRDEKIGSVDEVARYVAGYVGKSLGDDVPARFRRVRTSQGWPELAKPNSATEGLTWEYVSTNGQLNTVYARAKQGNFDMIDLRTGEIFDDVDLGTLAINA